MEIGSPFPQFSLAAHTGVQISNQDMLGNWCVIYFYPKDDTSGCTQESCEFRDVLTDIAGAHVFGVSSDSIASHVKFAKKYDLNFPLLSDSDKSLAEALGIWVEKSMYGKKYMGIERTTFLIDPQGNIAMAWRKVKPAGHAAEVAAKLRQLRG